MVKSAVVLQLILAFFKVGLSQSAQLKLSIVDSSAKNPAEYIFRVTLMTDSTNLYWIQDTAYMKANVGEPFDNLISPQLAKLVGAKYKIYNNFTHRPGHLPVWCADNCCNCIYLGHEQSISFDLNLLRCCSFEPGSYRLAAYIVPPLNSIDSTSPPNMRGVESNEVYFRVR